MDCSKWKGSVPDIKKKILSLHSYLKRSMPGTLFGTLTKLLYSVQKHLLPRTNVVQKPVKWFAMQNSWLVPKPFTFLVKGISKQALTHFQPIFHLNKPGSWFLLAKCLKNHLWKSDIIIKDTSHWPVSLLKMSLYHNYFLANFASKIQLYISGFFIVEYWSINRKWVWSDFKYIYHALGIYYS